MLNKWTDSSGRAEGEPGFGLVLVTHGRIGEALLEALQHIVGPRERIRAVAIGPGDDIDQRRAEILEAISAVDGGFGVVVMTDMFGGTPSNLALSALGRGMVEVVAGVNLPMLVKFASLGPGLSLDEAVALIQASGRKYINVASHFLADADQG